MLSPKSKRNISRIIPFGIIWLVSTLIFFVVEEAIRSGLDQQLSTGIKIDFKIFVFGTLANTIVGLLEHEQKLKQQPIPELYKNKNVLRFEIRYRKQLRKQFNRAAITAGILSDETFYSDLVKRWKNEYLAIQKINSKLINMKPTGSKKQFIENLALYTVLELGQPKVLNKIKEWQESGIISKKQAYDLRVTTKQLSNDPIEKKGNVLC